MAPKKSFLNLREISKAPYITHCIAITSNRQEIANSRRIPKVGTSLKPRTIPKMFIEHFRYSPHLRLLLDEEEDWCRNGNNQINTPMNAFQIGQARLPLEQQPCIGMGGQGSGTFRNFDSGLLLSPGIDRWRCRAEARFEFVELLLQYLELRNRIVHKGETTIPVGNRNQIGNQSRFVVKKRRLCSDGECLMHKVKRKKRQTKHIATPSKQTTTDSACPK